MKVVCITGMPGAGKGEVVRVLSEEKGLVVVRMGDVVWDFVKRAGLPLEPGVVGPFANSERETHGNDIWARRTVERVKRLGVEHVIIDGVRTPKEIEVFRESFGADLVLIRVDASREVRLARIMARGREDDSVSEEGFEQRDQRELSWGLGEVMAMADHAIVNNAGLEELRTLVLELFERNLR